MPCLLVRSPQPRAAAPGAPLPAGICRPTSALPASLPPLSRVCTVGVAGVASATAVGAAGRPGVGRGCLPPVPGPLAGAVGAQPPVVIAAGAVGVREEGQAGRGCVAPSGAAAALAPRAWLAGAGGRRPEGSARCNRGVCVQAAVSHMRAAPGCLGSPCGAVGCTPGAVFVGRAGWQRHAAPADQLIPRVALLAPRGHPAAAARRAAGGAGPTHGGCGAGRQGESQAQAKSGHDWWAWASLDGLQQAEGGGGARQGRRRRSAGSWGGGLRRSWPLHPILNVSRHAVGAASQD